jgi:hypothetical protein
MVRVQQKSTRQNHRFSQQPAFPAQWFYGLYVISPGTGFLAPVARVLVAPQTWHQHRDARTTRFRRPSQVVRPLATARCNPVRPPHPTSRAVTIAIRPLRSRQDVREHRGDLPDKTSLATCDKLARRAMCAGRLTDPPARDGRYSCGFLAGGPLLLPGKPFTFAASCALTSGF